MRVLPDNYFPPEADTDEKRFGVLAGRLFKADPAKVREKLAAEALPSEEDAEAPRKRGRPRKKRVAETAVT